MAQRWLSHHLYGLGLLLFGEHRPAALFSFFLLSPGILLHEFSHWLAAKALRVKVTGFSCNPRQQKGALRLASLTVATSDPFRASLIGLAPLLSGSLAIFLLIHLGWGSAIPWGSPPMEGIRLILSHLARYAGVPHLWFLVYLLFSVSNTMLPSEADRQDWASLLLFTALVALALYLARFPIPLWLAASIFQGLDYLTLALLLTMVVDGLCIALVYPLEWIAGILRGERVEYR